MTSQREAIRQIKGSLKRSDFIKEKLEFFISVNTFSCHATDSIEHLVADCA